MGRNKVFLLLIALILKSELACAVFGQSDVLLRDYYEFGKHQTGVAQVRTNKGLGTANLIDVDIESLKGRLMITCAHVIENGDEVLSSVRFMDKNNESQQVAVQQFFIPSRWREVDQDIGFIVLKESVDVERFKPLKLNLSQENKAFYGKLVSVYGCTPVFGKANSKVVIRETDSTSLRRGMTTVVADGDCNDSSLQSVFYPKGFLNNSKGLVRIYRDSTYGLEKKEAERKQEIEKELEGFDNLKTDGLEKFTLSMKRAALASELFDLTTKSIKIITRHGLSQTIEYTDNYKDKLKQLEDTEDLDKSTLITEWEQFINDARYGTKTLKLGAYIINFYGPQPRLSGKPYSGDSGGAWVIDDQIVALSKQVLCGTPYKDFEVIKKSSRPDESISTYFSECEDIISQLTPIDNKRLFAFYATSIKSCREWIQATLENIISQNM